MLAPHTLTLLDVDPAAPAGFIYRPEWISAAEENDLIEQFAGLPWKPFEFQGFTGHRRALSFGWQYDFTTTVFRQTGAIPPFLLPLRRRAAEFAGVAPEELEHVLLLEYPPGAAIGWHKDKPQFGKVIGVSLLSACKFRFRRKIGARWERASTVAEPRSVYLLEGPSRMEWEHSIPAVDSLRYSVTFRTLAPDRN